MDQEPTFEESVKQIMQALPPVVRHYLAEGRYTEVARDLITKYQLRIDQGGILEREIMLLIMGIETPDEFVGALANEAKIDTAAINGITQDINARIFVPLRDAERRGVMTPELPKPAPQQQPARPTPPAPQPSKPQFVPPKLEVPTGPRMYAPPPQSPAYPNQPVAEPMITFKRPISEPHPATPVPQSRPVPPHMRETNPSHLLEDHEEPHIEFHKKEAPTATPTPPSAPLPVPSSPRTQEAAPLPPPNLPGQSSERPPSSVILPKMRPPAPPPPAYKPYSTDPYREPLDE